MSSTINPDELPSAEQVLEAAQKVWLTGALGGNLDPRDPQNQVLVAGATVILASAGAGLSPDEVLTLIVQEAERRSGITAAAQEDSVRGNRGYL